MRNAVIALTMAAALAACNNGANPADEASATAKAADYKQLASCSAKMAAVGKLYHAIASQKTGAEAEELDNIGTQRGASGYMFMREAHKLAGPASAEVDALIKEEEARIQAEMDKQPFEEFAVAIGKEADKCAPLLPNN